MFGFTSNRGLLDEVMCSAIRWPFSKVMAVGHRSMTSFSGAPGVIILTSCGMRPSR